MSMHTLQLTIERRRPDDGYSRVVVEYRGPGELLQTHYGELSLEPGATFDGVQAELAPPEVYGRFLGEHLFAGAVREAFTAAAQCAAPERLHVRLFIEDPELQRLRWERLFLPATGGWRFATCYQGAPLSIYVPTRCDRHFGSGRRRGLRGLLLLSNPAAGSPYPGVQPFDEQRCREAVATAWADLEWDELSASPQAVGPPTLDALVAQITQRDYGFLHIVSHGALVVERQEPVLYLQSASGGVAPIWYEELRAALDQVRRLPSLVFLAACQSAVETAESGRGSLARRLVADLGVPAVVAMSDRVTVATASDAARGFYERLLVHGHPDAALAEACGPLVEREDHLVPVLYSRLLDRPLLRVGSDEDPLDAEAVQTVGGQLRELVRERAPVLYERLDRLLQQLREVDDQGGDGRAALLARLDGLCLEVCEVPLRDLVEGQAPPEAALECPFQGLHAFGASDARFFFGRDEIIERARETLERLGCVALVGPSGSGKSSLARAGLLAPLREAGAPTAELKPGRQPLQELQRTLTDLPREGYLLVDQLEELFTLSENPLDRLTFATRLTRLVQSGGPRLLLTVRRDFRREWRAEPLASLIEKHRVEVEPLGALALRRVLERQARDADLRLEPELLGAVLADLSDEAGRMPLAQLTMKELHGRRHGRWLRYEEFCALGGSRRVLESLAERVYRELPEDEREILLDMLVRLTHLDEVGTTPGVARDTRLRAPLRRFSPAGVPLERVQAIAAKLADEGLLVTDSPESGELEAEVAHEALIEHWVPLRARLDDAEQRPFYLWRQRLQRALARWEVRRRRGDLLSGTLLEEADGNVDPGRDLNTEERAFVDRSRRWDRQWHRLAVAAIVVLLILFGALAVSVVRLVESEAAAVSQAQLALLNAAEARQNASEARENARVATARAREANARRLAELATRTADLRFDLGLLLAAEAHELEPLPRVEEAWLDLLSRPYYPLALLPDASQNVRFEPGDRLLIDTHKGLERWALQGGTWAFEALVEATPPPPPSPRAGSDGANRCVERVAADPGRPARCATSRVTFQSWCGGADLALVGDVIEVFTEHDAAIVETSQGLERFTCLAAGRRLAIPTRPVELGDGEHIFAVRGPGELLRDYAARTGDGLRVAAPEYGYTVVLRSDNRLWVNEPAGAQIELLGAVASDVRFLAMDPEGPWIAGWGPGRAAIVWSWQPDGNQRFLPFAGRALEDLHRAGVIAAVPGSAPVALGTCTNQLQGGAFCDLRLHESLTHEGAGRTLRWSTGLATRGPPAVVMSLDGRFVAAGAAEVNVWHTDTGAQVLGGPVGVGMTDIRSLGFNADSTQLAVASESHPRQPARVVTIMGNPGQIAVGEEIWAATFHPTEPHELFTVGAAGVQRWSLGEGSAVPETLLNRGGTLLAISPDGTKLAVALAKGLVRVQSLDDGGYVWEEQRAEPPTCLAFSGDGERVAMGDSRRVEVWDLDGRAILQVAAAGAVEAVAFVADRYLLAATSSGVRAYDLDPDRWSQRTCEIARRNLSLEEWRRYVGFSEADYACGCPGDPCPVGQP